MLGLENRGIPSEPFRRAPTAAWGSRSILRDSLGHLPAGPRAAESQGIHRVPGRRALNQPEGLCSWAEPRSWPRIG